MAKTDSREVTVGEITVKSDGTVIAPEQYWTEQGREYALSLSESPTFRAAAEHACNAETAIAVAIQTDYAGWLGGKEIESWLS